MIKATNFGVFYPAKTTVSGESSGGNLEGGLVNDEDTKTNRRVDAGIMPSLRHDTNVCGRGGGGVGDVRRQRHVDARRRRNADHLRHGRHDRLRQRGRRPLARLPRFHYKGRRAKRHYQSGQPCPQRLRESDGSHASRQRTNDHRRVSVARLLLPVRRHDSRQRHEYRRKRLPGL